MSPYATFMPTLRKILAARQFESAVEFGCGMFSTEMLVTHCKSVLSIEMQDPEWARAVTDALKPTDRWRVEVALGPFAFLRVAVPTNVDLAFVDGHGSSRPECVNVMMGRGCPVIVAHDTEEPGYGWGRVIAGAYRRIDFTDLSPHTTIWTTQDL